MLADGSRASATAQTTVFEQNNTAADAEVRKIIAANGGPGFKPTAVASAAKPVSNNSIKVTETASTASAAASMATLAAGVNANAATVK